MLIAIALLNGVTDINLITSIAVLTSSCQLCGLAVEFVEQRSIKWLLHLTGWPGHMELLDMLLNQ